MAVLLWDSRVSAERGALVAVDGVNGRAVASVAREILAKTDGGRRGGISAWDASGVFEELAVAGKRAGLPSPRTLLLLYATDLAFRLRWEIRPALVEGRVVVAAPYVDTAIAFGRAIGISRKWLTEFFRFAPRPTKSRYVAKAPARRMLARSGFIEFGSTWARPQGVTRHQLVSATYSHLHAAARR